MSTDAAQIMQQPNSAAPTPQAAPADPTAALLKDLVNSAVQQHVAVALDGLTTQATQQASAVATNAVAGLQDAIDTTHAKSVELITNVAADVEKNRLAIETQLAQGAGQVLTMATKDVWTVRAVVGVVLIGALAVVAFALLGNATANRWIGAAPAAIGAVALYLADSGAITLPKKQVPPTTTVGG
jgi:hypothetical protein